MTFLEIKAFLRENDICAYKIGFDPAEFGVRLRLSVRVRRVGEDRPVRKQLLDMNLPSATIADSILKTVLPDPLFR